MCLPSGPVLNELGQTLNSRKALKQKRNDGLCDFNSLPYSNEKSMRETSTEGGYF